MFFVIIKDYPYAPTALNKEKPRQNSRIVFSENIPFKPKCTYYKPEHLFW